MSLRKVFAFSPSITTGNIVQILLTAMTVVLTFILGIRYATSEMKDSLGKQTDSINAQIDRIFSDPNQPGHITLKEESVYVFKDAPLSSITIVSIDPEKKEVKVRINIKGNKDDDILLPGNTRTIRVPNGPTYALILTGININEEPKTAEFVFTEVKE